MNLFFYIAKRIAFNKQKTFSRFIIRLSIAATSVSVMAMILALCFVNGFQQTIAEKVFSFWGHIRVQHFESDKSIVAEESAIEKNDSVENTLAHQKGVAHFHPFATKSAVLEKNKEIEGVLLKGINAQYDSNQLKKFLKEGRCLQFGDSMYSHEIIVPRPIAQSLQLKVNDQLNVYFISGNDGKSARRSLKVVGIYQTGIEEYDKQFGICDIRLIQRANDWKSNMIGGYEVFLTNRSQLDTISHQLNNDIPMVWLSRSIKDVYPNIFDWLSIQDLNRDIIIIVMAVVAIINLITCLLILVLERIKMVGILKALGANDGMIQQIFLMYAGFITLAGVGLGSMLGIGIAWLQQKTGFATLPEDFYAISKIEVVFDWTQIGWVCLGTCFVCLVSLTLPLLLIKRINLVKAIQFK